MKCWLSSLTLAVAMALRAGSAMAQTREEAPSAPLRIDAERGTEVFRVSENTPESGSVCRTPCTLALPPGTYFVWRESRSAPPERVGFVPLMLRGASLRWHAERPESATTRVGGVLFAGGLGTVLVSLVVVMVAGAASGVNPNPSGMSGSIPSRPGGSGGSSAADAFVIGGLVGASVGMVSLLVGFPMMFLGAPRRPAYLQDRALARRVRFHGTGISVRF